jgi:hypothetical protein
MNSNGAEIPIEAMAGERTAARVYLRIAEKAKHLCEPGMSDNAIARALGVNSKRSLRRRAMACAPLLLEHQSDRSAVAKEKPAV